MSKLASGLILLPFLSGLSNAKTGGHFKCQGESGVVYSYEELMTGKEMNRGWAHSKQWPNCYAVFSVSGREYEKIIVTMEHFKIKGEAFLPKSIPEKFSGYDQYHHYWRFSHHEPSGGE